VERGQDAINRLLFCCLVDPVELSLRGVVGHSLALPSVKGHNRPVISPLSSLTAMRRRLVLAGLVLVVLGAAGCSSGTSSPPTTTLGVNPNSHLTAVEEATSWFKAINAKNREASLAHYEANTRYNIGDWNYGDVSQWPTFTNVDCKPVSSTTSTATVRCTFRSHGDASSAGDTFWTITYRRASDGPWLITSYGQP
jgi:hypothetical protein